MIPFRSIPFDGIANATSQLNRAHGIDNAFRYSPGPNISMAPWCTKTIVNREKPGQIWFQFEKEITLSKIGFSSRNGYPEQLPKKFQVIGRNLGGAWQIVAEVEDADFNTKSGNEPKAWLIPAENRQKVRWLGLRILSTHGKSSKVCLHNMIMWEER